MGFLKRYFLISRAAFETLERAKHWTAFHVAQYIPGCNKRPCVDVTGLAPLTAEAAQSCDSMTRSDVA